MIRIEVIIPCRNACRVRSRIVVLKTIKTMVAEQLASLEGRSLVRVIIVKFPSDIAAHDLVNYCTWPKESNVAVGKQRQIVNTLGYCFVH